MISIFVNALIKNFQMNSGHALLQFEKQNLRALNAGAPAKNMQHPENVKVT